MEFPTFTWLVLGFGLGLVHAFDADHVMALSVYATGEKSAGAAARAGLRWALGHGAVILIAGVLLLFLGRELAPGLADLAERGVGVVMVGLGIYVWVELARRSSHVHFHKHDDLPPHAHWHVHPETQRTDLHASSPHRGFGESVSAEANHSAAHRHQHGAVMVGALHGLAGSAPLLAVLPAAARSPELGLAYLAFFTLGVGLAMAAVSGLMGHVAGRLSRDGRMHGLSRLRALSASGSIGLGAWLIALG